MPGLAVVRVGTGNYRDLGRYGRRGTRRSDRAGWRIGRGAARRNGGCGIEVGRGCGIQGSTYRNGAVMAWLSVGWVNIGARSCRSRLGGAGRNTGK